MKRRAEAGLPPRVYLKHGRYWHVHRGKWTALSRDVKESITAGERLNANLSPGWNRELQASLEACFRSRRNHAKARGIQFTVDMDEVLNLVRAHRWRCAVTDIPFSLEREPGKRVAPFAPSIDRIICQQGYVPGNVRVVCTATNFAMNEWGDAIVKRLAEGWLKAEFSRRVLDV